MLFYIEELDQIFELLIESLDEVHIIRGMTLHTVGRFGFAVNNLIDNYGITNENIAEKAVFIGVL